VVTPETSLRPPRRNAAWLRVAALGGVLAAATALVLLSDLGDVARLRATVEDAGPLAPVVFALAYAVITLAPLPKNALGAAAGLVFGLTTGVVVTWAGAMLGAAAAFGLARTLGRESVQRVTDARGERVDAFLARRGFLAVVTLRLVPVLPFTAVNYGSGLTSVRTTHYLAGTAFGIIPGTIAYVALGAFGADPGSWEFVTAVAALVLLSLVGLALRRLRRRTAGTS